MADNPQINELEQSLINFLCSKKEVETLVSGGTKRVRSLMLNLCRKEGKQAFTVQIGMCEAVFNAKTGLKEKGNIFGCERFIRDWFERPSITMAITKYFQEEEEDKKK